MRSENTRQQPLLDATPGWAARPITLGKAVCFSEAPANASPARGPRTRCSSYRGPHGPVKWTRENDHPMPTGFL